MEAVTAGATVAPLTSVLLHVEEDTQIGGARRSAIALGNAHGLSTDAVGRLAIVVTEAATNIVRHAGHGVIVMRPLGVGSSAAIEVLALDKGPGISDVARAMRDGFSTSGTAGQGLGGIQRLADVFEMYSQRDTGTALLARVGDDRRALAEGEAMESVDERVGAVCVPIRGETECGDAWAVVAAHERIAILLVDGLGHGPGAATAAAAATTAFARLAAQGKSPEAAMAAIDTALRGTRGAALSLAVIDEAACAMQFGGVGNVEGRVLGRTTEHLVPQNGIVGHTMPRLRPSAATWVRGARLVLHSDGISSRWRADAYPGLLDAHPALLAGVIYRDFARDRDDATVVVFATDKTRDGAS